VIDNLVENQGFGLNNYINIPNQCNMAKFEALDYYVKVPAILNIETNA
jgi:hypothetical protein